MKRIVAAALWTLVALVVLALPYGADWALLRLRSQPTGQVEIHRYWAVRMKGSKMEYAPIDQIRETCTHSLFPQRGCLPCWYLSRHRLQMIKE